MVVKTRTQVEKDCIFNQNIWYMPQAVSYMHMTALMLHYWESITNLND